ncbi:MAG TPA: glycoside hydrolase family 3 N-terminal domain-containing protein [Anaerolineales bacterium]|nr:glycoside hydrolase family 3 N-terminal domain-containing protein [Anaerolineales bacterium]
MWLFYLLLIIILIAGGVYFWRNILPVINTRRNLALLGQEAPTLTQDGITFRDLNKNGRLDPYEDPRRPVEERVEDLLRQMTLEEKAGLMFQTMIGMNKDGTILEKSGMFPLPQTSDMIARRLMNHFNILFGSDPRHMAEWHNRIQKLAERTRLGIPITISTDPRHSFAQNPLASLGGGSFSQFPEPTGLAATRDADLVREFGDIARQEYLAVGIRLALHPMADLATEPRWARANGTFGEDADLSAEMTAAYIRGFQGEKLGKDSVACMTKHFPGGGPQMNGEDAHFHYGREQVYPGNNFDYHLKSFEAAFKAGTAQIMPYYGMPVGTPLEEVGFGFNKDVITDLLRGKYGFDGVVCTDWGLLTSMRILGRDVFPARAWGVEHLSRPERAQKALDAGVDQFGGEDCTEVIVQLVRAGKVSEERIDQSVRRLLRDKFILGLFDNPYVDVEAAEKILGKPEFRKVGELAQRKSVVLLKNEKQTLPLRNGLKIYVENLKPEAVRQYGQVVEDVAQADIAILRLNAPYEKRKGLAEGWFHAGELDFKEPEKGRILNILQRVPTIVDIYLERPAVIPEIAEKSAALLANFGASDEAMLDVIFGKFAPQGKLPFELPSSMEAVRKQKEDLPHDSENPLFPFGHGLGY